MNLPVIKDTPHGVSFAYLNQFTAQGVVNTQLRSATWQLLIYAVVTGMSSYVTLQNTVEFWKAI